MIWVKGKKYPSSYWWPLWAALAIFFRSMLSRFIATVFGVHLPRLSWLPGGVCSPLLYLCLPLSLSISLFLIPSLMLFLLVVHSFLAFSFLSLIPSSYSLFLPCSVFLSVSPPSLQHPSAPPSLSFHLPFTTFSCFCPSCQHAFSLLL